MAIRHGKKLNNKSFYVKNRMLTKRQYFAIKMLLKCNRNAIMSIYTERLYGGYRKWIFQ